MTKVASLLPNTIEQATKGTPVAMLLQVVDRQNIEAFLAIELTKTASLINVDERLNLQGHQIPFIASQLIDLYKSESLADFKICFERGAMGRYDEKLLRLDAAVINNWMQRYLEEKYQVIENQLMSSKDSIYQVKREIPDMPMQINHDRTALAAMEAVVNGKDVGVDLSKYLKPEEVKEVEQAQRKGPVHFDENNERQNKFQKFKLFQQLLRQATKEFYGKKPSVEFDRFDDDDGQYLYAANMEDAIKIYNNARAKKTW